MDKVVISPPCFSASRSPSSIANSSSSLMTASAASLATVLSSWRSSLSVPVSGTCLTQTVILITGGSLPRAPHARRQ
jgi:hypothetical protein